MRMIQRGLKYNHSRFYTDSTDQEDLLPQNVSRLIINKLNSRQDMQGSTGESSQGSTVEDSQDSKTSLSIADHENPCAIPASMSKLLHYIDVHDQPVRNLSLRSNELIILYQIHNK